MLSSTLHPFPAAVAERASGPVEALLADVGNLPPDVFQVLVQGESITIPSRIYVDAPAFRAGHPRAEPFTDCLLTRHHSGFVRSAALAEVLAINQPWSMPYVFQLAGEYVIEILDQIDAAFDEIDPDAAAAFVRENSAFVALTRQRVASYWDVYYRTQARERYVGFRLIDRFERLGRLGDVA